MSTRRPHAVLTMWLALQAGCADSVEGSDENTIGQAATSLIEAPSDADRLFATGTSDLESSADLRRGESSSLPVRGSRESRLTNATAIAAGSAHSCAVSNGRAYCWGSNWRGQLGDGSTYNDRPSADQVKELAHGVTAIAGGEGHTCALIKGGAQCWGDNLYGQVGNNSTTVEILLPVPVQGLASGVAAIATAGNHTCALVDGGVQCWGINDGLQIGHPDATNFLAPISVEGVTSSVTAVAAGGWHTCSVANGAVLCWGNNALGNGSPQPTYTPTQVQGISSRATAIVAGVNHSCAVVDGCALCWGSNETGQLGNSSVDWNSLVPVHVEGLASGVTALTAGGGHTCAIVDGRAYCWGANDGGQIGDGSNVNRPAPVRVRNLPSGVTAIAAGGGHTCALVRGNVWCWGYNWEGQLGDGSYTHSSMPVAVLELRE